MNTKINGVIHCNIVHLLAIISLDFKLVCKFCECLSKECSAAIQKEEQRLCTYPRYTSFVRLK